MSEDTKKVKEPVETKTTAGVDQPEQKTTEPPKGAEKPGEETVSISKSELEQLRKNSEDLEHYRGAVKRFNKGGRVLPGSEPASKKKGEGGEGDGGDDSGEDQEDKEEFLTKKDLQRRDENAAIRAACKDSFIDENWNDIVVYYEPKRGKASKEDILEDIKEAAEKFKILHPEKVKKPEPGKKVAADLSKDAGLGDGKEKQPKAPEKKRIIPKKEKMGDWY